MILPGLIALIYRDGAGRAFTQTFFVALAIGSLLWWPNRREKGELKSREGFLIVVLFWTVLGSVGSLPFIFSEQPNLSITDAFFESFSGLTTTGATTLVGLDSLPGIASRRLRLADSPPMTPAWATLIAQRLTPLLRFSC